MVLSARSKGRERDKSNGYARVGWTRKMGLARMEKSASYCMLVKAATMGAYMRRSSASIGLQQLRQRTTDDVF